jgi:hypothetical protein
MEAYVTQDGIQEAASCHGGRIFTLARAFLHGTQALRVTDSGTLRRFDDALPVVLPSTSFSPRIRRGSDPVVDSDVFGVLVGVLLSPNDGRILRNALLNALLDLLDMVNNLWTLPSARASVIKRTAASRAEELLMLLAPGDCSGDCSEEYQDCGFLMQAAKWMDVLTDLSKGCALECIGGYR